MSYLIARSFKKPPPYLVTFLPMALLSYAITIGLANATEVGVLDEGSNLSLIKKLEEGKGLQIVQEVQAAPSPVVQAPPQAAPPPPSPVVQAPIVGSVPGSSTDINTDASDGSKLVSAPWIMMDPPLPSPKVTFYDSITGEKVTKAWRQMENKEIVRLLNNKTIQVATGQLDATGQVNYINVQTTGKVGRYKVLMDYTPYMVEDFVDEINKKIGTAKVGVGYRLIADINTYSANIDISSLPALSAAAKLKKLDGKMTIETIGITLDGNSGILLSPKTIDDKSIAENLRTLEVLQSRITDKSTYLDPQIIWVKPVPVRVYIQDTSKGKKSWWRKILDKITLQKKP